MGTDYLYSNALPTLDASDSVSEVGTDVPAQAVMLYDNVGSQYMRWRQVNTAGDAIIPNGLGAIVPYLYNGANYDRFREFPSADNQARLGLLGAGIMLWDPVAASHDRFQGDEVKGARVHVHEGRAMAFVAGGANAAATLTIPANVNGFIYVTYLRIARVATAALAGGALLTITTTGITGAPTFRCGNVMAAGGTTDLINMTFSPPLRGSAVNTAMTFVAPAPGVAVSWDMEASYHHSP